MFWSCIPKPLYVPLGRAWLRKVFRGGPIPPEFLPEELPSLNLSTLRNPNETLHSISISEVCKRILFLDLTRSCVTDNALLELAKAIETHHLVLDFCERITETGLINFLSTTKNLRRLSVVFLFRAFTPKLVSNCLFTRKDYIGDTSSFIELNITGCKLITNRVKSMMEERMPNCVLKDFI